MTCISTNWSCEEISALANSVMAIGVLLAYWQLIVTERLAQLRFEDGLAKEYRDLAAKIPTQVFYGDNLSERDFDDARDQFFRYFDLSNEQVSLRAHGRISSTVWVSWRDGIKYNLNLPAFKRAWEEVKTRTGSFSELRRLEDAEFNSDPRTWH
jgi:hypothetical protein